MLVVHKVPLELTLLVTPCVSYLFLNSVTMNLKLNYSYSEGQAGRIYAAAVFSNPSGLDVRDIEQLLLTRLVCGLHFRPTEWNVPLSWNLIEDESLMADFDGIEETWKEANAGSIDELLCLVPVIERKAA